MTDDIVNGQPTLERQLVQLGAEDNIFLADGSVDHYHIARHFLGQGSHRRDADTSGDQSDSLAATHCMGKYPKRSFRHDHGSGP